MCEKAFVVFDFYLLWGQAKVREEKKSLLEVFATL